MPHIFALLLCAIALSGCAYHSTAHSEHHTTTTRLTAPLIQADTASVDIINDYIPDPEPPYVDHKLSPHPHQELTTWLEKQIHPRGRDGRTIVRIQECSLRWRQRPGRLEKMRYWPYKAVIRVTLEVVDRDGEQVRSWPIHLQKVRELYEGFFRSPDREEYRRLFKELQNDLYRELNRAIRLGAKSKPIPQLKAHKPLATRRQRRKQQSQNQKTRVPNARRKPS